ASPLDVMMNNLFADLPDSLAEELTSVLVQSPQVRIERIVSCGQRSPDRFWYDQHEVEWVVVLRAAARLPIEGASAPRHLPAGDEPTVWLAVFFAEGMHAAVSPRHRKESKHGPV